MPVCRKCKSNHPEFVVNGVEWKCDYTATDIHNIHNETLKNSIEHWFKNKRKEREEYAERVALMRHEYMFGGIFNE